MPATTLWWLPAFCQGTDDSSFIIGCFEPLVDKRTKKYEIFPANGQILLTAFFCGAAWAILRKENGFSPGFVKSLPKFKKVLAPYAGARCIMLPRKRAEYKWMLTGGRSGDISCRKKDVSCRRLRKARKYATLNVYSWKTVRGRPRTRREFFNELSPIGQTCRKARKYVCITTKWSGPAVRPVAYMI